MEFYGSVQNKGKDKPKASTAATVVDTAAVEREKTRQSLTAAIREAITAKQYKVAEQLAKQLEEVA